MSNRPRLNKSENNTKPTSIESPEKTPKAVFESLEKTAKPTIESPEKTARAASVKKTEKDDKNAVIMDVFEEPTDVERTQYEAFSMKCMEDLSAEPAQQSSDQNLPAIIGKQPHTPSEKKAENKVLNAAWEELEKEEWYHGMIPIEDAKSMLNKNGDFLVRKINRESRWIPPVLTVLWDTILYHFPLYEVQRGNGCMEFTVNTINCYPSFSSVINAHLSKKSPVFREIMIVKGAPKQSWELDRQNISLEMKIGEGEYGEVWKGMLKTKNSEAVSVAVKLMKVNVSNQEQLEMFHQEARLMRVYNHKNVVKLYGMVFSDSDVMVVMELVSGGGLDSYLKKKSLMPLVKASFCYDIAAGLSYLHHNNCMHRDVAARNCLVTSDNRMVKLSDFGLAAHGRRTKLTQFDKVPIRWQAPEVLFHHIYMRESDVWSYGMLMSEIFNDGKVPFHGKPITEIRQRIHDPTFRPFVPQLVNYPEIPVIMQKCWSIDVAKRPRMKTIAKILQKYCIHTIKEKLEHRDAPKQKFVHRRQNRGSLEKCHKTPSSTPSKKDNNEERNQAIVNATAVEHDVQGQPLTPVVQGKSSASKTTRSKGKSSSSHQNHSIPPSNRRRRISKS